MSIHLEMSEKSRIVLAIALLLAIVRATPAHALLCGDGILDPLLLEECDDGNNLPGDCCSALCQLEAQGTICRASTGTCDPQEVCSGLSDVCPADIVIPDGDGDTVCDPTDLCPTVPDPAQIDLDGDAIGDACDTCVNVGDIGIDKAKLTMSKLNPPLGDDRVRLKGAIQLPPGPAVDPMIGGLHLLITDGSNTTLVDATIPPGPFDPNTRTGWRANANGSVFSFRNGTDAPELGGVQRIILKVNPSAPGALRFVIIGRDGDYTKPDTAPVTVVLNANAGVPGQCAELQFNALEFGPKCSALNGGARLVCR